MGALLVCERSVAATPPPLICSLEVSVWLKVFFPSAFDTIPLKPSGPTFLGRFLIKDSVSLIDVGLQIFSILFLVSVLVL